MKVPKDFPVQQIRKGTKAAQAAKALAECGTCHRSWDDAIPTAYTPVPSGRCPFEYYHRH